MELAIFGGTFDPVHNAHLAAARAARDTFRLDRILLIPNAIPPHKQGSMTASYADRLAMVQLAIEGEAALEASDLEAGTGKSYSIHTIERVSAELSKSDKLYFIIGADAFAEIETWFRWRDVVERVVFIVVARPGHNWIVPEPARVLRLDQVYMDVSSSAIRSKLARCEQPGELPEPVFRYIREHALYGYGSACPDHPRLALRSHPVSGYSGSGKP